MYTPYDQNKERTNYVTPGKVGLGVAAIGAGFFAKSAFGNMMNGMQESQIARNGGTRLTGFARKYARWASSSSGNPAATYRSMINGSAKFSQVNPTGGFFHQAKSLADEFSYSHGIGRVFGAKNATRQASRLDKGIYNLFGKGKGVVAGQSMLAKTSGVGLFGMMTINQEYDRLAHPAALPLGVARELTTQAGGRIGMGIGSSLGMLVGGPVGAMIGTVAGMALGGLVGHQAISGIGGMASLGRKWTTPGTGGAYKDSHGAMTMRQRSLDAVRTSQFNIRTELGNESFRLATGF